MGADVMLVQLLLQKAEERPWPITAVERAELSKQLGAVLSAFGLELVGYEAYTGTLLGVALTSSRVS